jgi:hypothetical protein
MMVAGKFGLIDTQGNKVLDPQYMDIGSVSGKLVPVRKRAKWGFVDLKGKPLGEPKYDQVWEQRNGHMKVKAGEFFGLVDSTGKEVFTPRFNGLSDVQQGVVVATEAGRTGIVDLAGKVRIPLAYDTVELMDARTAKLKRNELLAYARIADGVFIWKEEGFDRPEEVPTAP